MLDSSSMTRVKDKFHFMLKNLEYYNSCNSNFKQIKLNIKWENVTVTLNYKSISWNMSLNDRK